MAISFIGAIYAAPIIVVFQIFLFLAVGIAACESKGQKITPYAIMSFLPFFGIISIAYLLSLPDMNILVRLNRLENKQILKRIEKLENDQAIE